MNKHLLIIFCALLSTGLYAQNDTITAYTFPTGVDTTDIYPNAGLSSNSGRYISAEDTVAWPNTVLRHISMTEGVGGLGDYAGTVDGWENGANAKLWSIKFKAEGYTNLRISSKQFSDETNPGPRDWKLQCRFSGEDWVDIQGGTVICSNNWTSGVVNELPLPAEFNNPGSSSMYIRWIMISDISTSGEPVLTDGISKIDDVILLGTSNSGVDDILYSNNLKIYPNPAHDFVNIESTNEIQSISIHNMQGKLVKQINKVDDYTKIYTDDLAPGNYMIRTKLIGFDSIHISKLIVN
ncbi:MAG: T9SS type A sorting domain-containing protein [Bacteroidales bacterium]|nr:T9SS type A sorting domain-containing protein [Bacteroidales bacterium]